MKDCGQNHCIYNGCSGSFSIKIVPINITAQRQKRQHITSLFLPDGDAVSGQLLGKSPIHELRTQVTCHTRGDPLHPAVAFSPSRFHQTLLGTSRSAQPIAEEKQNTHFVMRWLDEDNTDYNILNHRFVVAENAQQSVSNSYFQLHCPPVFSARNPSPFLQKIIKFHK